MSGISLSLEQKVYYRTGLSAKLRKNMTATKRGGFLSPAKNRSTIFCTNSIYGGDAMTA